MPSAMAGGWQLNHLHLFIRIPESWSFKPDSDIQREFKKDHFFPVRRLARELHVVPDAQRE